MFPCYISEDHFSVIEGMFKTVSSANHLICKITNSLMGSCHNRNGFHQLFSYFQASILNTLRAKYGVGITRNVTLSVYIGCRFANILG